MQHFVEATRESCRLNSIRLILKRWYVWNWHFWESSHCYSRSHQYKRVQLLPLQPELCYRKMLFLVLPAVNSVSFAPTASHFLLSLSQVNYVSYTLFLHHTTCSELLELVSEYQINGGWEGYLSNLFTTQESKVNFFAI